MTKIWRESSEPDGSTEAQILGLEDHLGIYMAVMGCRSMAGQFPRTSVEILSDHPPTDYFETGGMFVVSEKLKSVLDEFKVNCEYFHLQVVYHESEFTHKNFYFCNILDCIECFDLVRGEYTFWEKPGFRDRVDKIKKLAIDEEKVADHDLFRIAKGGEYFVCASDRLASRITDLHLTGMVFRGVADWNVV